MIDIVIVSLTSLAASIAIGCGPAAVHCASCRAAQADADGLRARLAKAMVENAAWRSKAISLGWSAEDCPALAPRSDNVIPFGRRAPRVPVELPDLSA